MKFVSTDEDGGLKTSPNWGKPVAGVWLRIWGPKLVELISIRWELCRPKISVRFFLRLTCRPSHPPMAESNPYPSSCRTRSRQAAATAGRRPDPSYWLTQRGRYAGVENEASKRGGVVRFGRVERGKRRILVCEAWESALGEHPSLSLRGGRNGGAGVKRATIPAAC